MKLEEKEEVTLDAGDMKRPRNGEIWDFELDMPMADGGAGVILGLDGGTTSTVCICMPLIPFSHSQPESFPILARAVDGCSNHNSVGDVFVKKMKGKIVLSCHITFPDCFTLDG